MTHKKEERPSIVRSFIHTLSQSILRPIPTLVGSVSVLIFSTIIYFTTALFSYTINDISVLIQFYIIGFIIGCIYEYVRLLIKHSQL